MEALRKHRLPRRLSRGLILPLVLLILMLLAILSSSFAFQINAYQAAGNVTSDRVQLRLAADSGLQFAQLLLRENRHDPALWYDNEDLFHNEVVYSALGDRAEIDVAEEIDTSVVTYRYSLVADDPLDDEFSVRYGLTGESSKLNINVATPEQLTVLFSQVLPDDLEVSVQSLVEALVDWRDRDDEPLPEGAESEYYLSLDPPYAVKNGMFETVEELLLVKGFSAWMLYGEDADRNGIMTPNENDGDDGFPPDNEDNQLFRGLYPYLTVYSRDWNRSNDNIPRIDLNMGDVRQLQEDLEEWFEEDIIDFIVAARRNSVTFVGPVQLLTGLQIGGGGDGGGGGGSGRNDDGAGGEADEGDEGQGNEQDDGSGQEPPGFTMDSPVELGDLPALFDRTTTIRQPGVMGMIDINTAPREVLMCLVNDQFTELDVDALLGARSFVAPEERATVAWLLMHEVISPEAMQAIYPQITARNQQYHVESIGHADHLGMMVRLEAIIEMRGHVAQYLYYRDISEVGSYPIRGTREGDQVVRDRRG